VHGSNDDEVIWVARSPYTPTRLFVNDPVQATAFSPTDFAAFGTAVRNCTGPNSGNCARYVDPDPAWLPNPPLLADPLARWIGTLDVGPNGEQPPNTGGRPRSVLYRQDFSAPPSTIASLELSWAVDDNAGDSCPLTLPPNPNPMGFYLNGTPLNVSGGSHLSESSVVLTGLNLNATNQFYAYQRDCGGVTSGLVYSAKFTVEPASITMSGLRNFDVIPPEDEDVNDFHIKLKGVDGLATNPAQIDHVYPQNVGFLKPPCDASATPPYCGWYPADILPMGNDTIISYGTGGTGVIPAGFTPHFGVELTDLGKDALEEICAYWTLDGEPVGDRNMPLSTIVDDPDGGSKVQLINQECGGGETTWVGPINAGIADRHAVLGELAADSEILEFTQPISEGFTELGPGKSVTIGEASFEMVPGTSFVLSYDVYKDADADGPGERIGTVYDAFNISGLVGDVNGSGEVDFADFLILSANFGTVVDQGCCGDLDGDGRVAFADFLILSGNFGEATSLVAVPEPSSLAGFLLIATSLSLRMRRRRRACVRT